MKPTGRIESSSHIACVDASAVLAADEAAARRHEACRGARLAQNDVYDACVLLAHESEVFYFGPGWEMPPQTSVRGFVRVLARGA